MLVINQKLLDEMKVCEKCDFCGEKIPFAGRYLLNSLPLAGRHIRYSLPAGGMPGGIHETAGGAFRLS